MKAASPKRPPAHGQPLRVLMVEDSPADVELCLNELKKAGFRVRADIVGSAEEFTERLRANSYDIILADQHPPAWTGMDALALLQELGLDIPLLLVTATLDEERAIESLKLGVADYVTKDRLARLPVSIRRALGQRALRDERAGAEQALRESEASFRLLFAHNPFPMWVFDLQSSKFLHANDAAVARYGYSREKILEMRLTDILPPEDVSRFLQALAEHPEALWPAGLWRHRLQDGRIIDVEIACHTLEFAGRPAGVAVVQDITERKPAGEALRHSERRYRELFENATYGIFRAALSGKFLDVNPALVRMLGHSSKTELLEKDLATEVYRNPTDSARLRVGYGQTGRIEGEEVEWKRKDGSLILVRLTGSTVADEHGNLEAFEIIVEDVTERRAMERHLSQVQKFEAIGKLAGGVAHDFNNVIGAILGWAELGLEQVPAGNPLHSNFKKIREQADRAAGLTRQLLAFARRQLLEPRNIDLNQVVTDLLSLLEKVISKDVEVKIGLAPDLSLIRADPTQIEQVLMNLCLNARDAMPRGGRLLIETRNSEIDEEFCRHHSYARQGRYALLTVSDTGMGMDAATLERIFEPFFTTKEMGKGTGLGLATVYGIVKQHGGILHAYSEVGHGTTFHVYLPATGGAIETAPKHDRPADETVRGGTETILVAEDHDGVREMARATLEGLGYQVLLASDGEAAVRMFCEQPEGIALVVLDVVMPKLGGPEAYPKMCAVKPDLPVLFTTGYSAESGSLGTWLEKGAAVLQKPYIPTLLGHKVREILDRASPVPARRRAPSVKRST